jgi:drug/metabolite transporter (DMT)-like permease
MNQTMHMKKNYTAHLCMFVASIIWGLMSPVGKDILSSDITAFTLVSFRMFGGALCFWIASLFTKSEEVPPHDLLKMFFASLFLIVFNQGMFIFGLSMTSPIDAAIISTLAPIVTMILAAIYLSEPVTGKKVGGVFVGAIGALILVLGSRAAGGRSSSVLGDLMCFTAQVSYSIYLTFFKGLLNKYHSVTCMKWMFTYSALCFIPFSYKEMATLDWAGVPTHVWGEVAFVIFGATFLTFLLLMAAQRVLRPTVLSMYNYVQPIVASIVAVIWGLGTFGWSKALAIVLVFLGVYIVTQSKSKAQMDAEKLAAEQTTEAHGKE